MNIRYPIYEGVYRILTHDRRIHPILTRGTGQADRNPSRETLRRDIQQLTRSMGIPHEMGNTHGTGMERNKSRNTHILSRRVPRENNNLR